MMMVLLCTSDQDADSALKELMLQLSSVWLRMVVVLVVMVMVLVVVTTMTTTTFMMTTEKRCGEVGPLFPSLDIAFVSVPGDKDDEEEEEEDVDDDC